MTDQPIHSRAGQPSAPYAALRPKSLARLCASVLTALLCCWSLSARAQQFDLECGYGEGTHDDDRRTGYVIGSPKHVQVDMDAGLWCEDFCSSYSRYEIVSANDLEVTLATPESGSVYQRRYLILNRESGALSETVFRDGGQTELVYPCEVTQFSNFERSQRQAPHGPLTRIMGAFLGKEGKKLLKNTPEGNFEVYVTMQFDVEGIMQSCAARAETPNPELEEGTCEFLMDGDFQFYPATNRDREAVAGEYRTTIVFAK